jgi:hypothetical protein
MPMVCDNCFLSITPGHGRVQNFLLKFSAAEVIVHFEKTSLHVVDYAVYDRILPVCGF